MVQLVKESSGLKAQMLWDPIKTTAPPRVRPSEILEISEYNGNPPKMMRGEQQGFDKAKCCSCPTPDVSDLYCAVQSIVIDCTKCPVASEASPLGPQMSDLPGFLIHSS